MRRGYLRGRQQIVALGVLLAGMLAAQGPGAFALDPTLDISQYAHKAWKVREGFTKGMILSIAQTPDGYLWLGTEFGLFRFDGVRTVAWQPPAGEQLPSNWVEGLLAQSNGALWIATEKGLAVWKNGELHRFPELEGRNVTSVIQDREGTVWAGAAGASASFSIGLCAIQQDRPRCYGEDGSLGFGVTSLYEDRKGNLWAGALNGLWRWKPGPPKFYPMPGRPAPYVSDITEDSNGTLLIATTFAGIQQFISEKFSPYTIPGIAWPVKQAKLLREDDGSLWIGTADRGLLHVNRGKTDVFAEGDGLSGNWVSGLFQDHEGNIWTTTTDGLDRFREFSVSRISTKQGLSSNVVFSLLAPRDGTVWIGTLGGLNHWNNGQITRYHKRNGLPDDLIDSLIQDSEGRIWIATPRGIVYFEGDRFTPVHRLSGGRVMSLVRDRAGDLWIDSTTNLAHVRETKIIEQLPWTTLGKNQPVTMVGDTVRGGLWLGFLSGGVAYFRDGQVRASYGVSDGLTGGRVNDLYFDSNDELWIASEAGLSRRKNGRFTTLTSKNGLPCDAVNTLTEDDHHSFWLYMPCGLVRIARTELNAWMADPTQKVTPAVFDTFDGVRGRAGSTYRSSRWAKMPDGKLWFISGDGVSVIDPQHLVFNKVPPPVHIEQITADHKSYDLTSHTNGSLPLPARVRDLEIDYTALSLATWEKVLFRYKLEGVDPDWQDAGTRRQAFYTNLSPGNYTFRVMACNNSGVWNEAGATLDFFVAPAYYQTTWFLVLCIAAFLGLTAALYQLRLRSLTRQVKGQMEARVKERERIARDLHDTLLQSVQGLILKFDAVAKQIPPDDPARAALEKTLDHADKVLAEGRDRVRHLRDSTVPFGGLPAAFQQVAEETPQGRETTFKTLVEGHVRLLHPMVREEAYCIGREALVNALTHSQGLQVEIEITYDARQFRLRVRDDGRGLDPKTLKDGGRSGHWGLQGMRERSERIGGQLKIWSGPETGTEIELTVPGATAYHADGDESKHSWLRTSSSRSRGNSSGSDGEQK